MTRTTIFQPDGLQCYNREVKYSLIIKTTGFTRENQEFMSNLTLASVEFLNAPAHIFWRKKRKFKIW